MTLEYKYAKEQDRPGRAETLTTAPLRCCRAPLSPSQLRGGQCPCETCQGESLRDHLWSGLKDDTWVFNQDPDSSLSCSFTLTYLLWWGQSCPRGDPRGEGQRVASRQQLALHWGPRSRSPWETESCQWLCGWAWRNFLSQPGLEMITVSAGTLAVTSGETLAGEPS